MFVLQTTGFKSVGGEEFLCYKLQGFETVGWGRRNVVLQGFKLKEGEDCLCSKLQGFKSCGGESSLGAADCRVSNVCLCGGGG